MARKDTRIPNSLEIFQATAVQTDSFSSRQAFEFLRVQLTWIPFVITYKLMYRDMTIWLQIRHILPGTAAHSLCFIYLFPILLFDQL